MEKYVSYLKHNLSKDYSIPEYEKQLVLNMFIFYFNFAEIIIKRYNNNRGKVKVSKVKEDLTGEVYETLITQRNFYYKPNRKISFEINNLIKGSNLIFGEDIPTFPINEFIDTLLHNLFRLDMEKGIVLDCVEDSITLIKEEETVEFDIFREFKFYSRDYYKFKKESGIINLNFYPINVVYKISKSMNKK